MLAQIIVHYYFTGSLLWFCGLSFALNAPACWGSVQNAKLDWCVYEAAINIFSFPVLNFFILAQFSEDLAL